MHHKAEQKSKMLEEFRNNLKDQMKAMPFWIFLCGPALNQKKPSASAQLRQKIKDKLEDKGFGVMLGEDDGLEHLRKNFGLDAQNNELKFIQTDACKVIIIIADSVGSYCELGLFNWLFADRETNYIDRNKIKFYVIANKRYEKHNNYFNEGPIKALRAVNAHVEYSDFNSYNIDNLVEEINSYRSLFLPSFLSGNK